MNITPSKISGVFLVQSRVFKDDRGSFYRLFCSEILSSVLEQRKIVQINHSCTQQMGAVRGIHYQYPPQAEMKIVRCLAGRVFDVAVDLRCGSPTFLQWTSAELSPSNLTALVIPEGCAHGFQVLEPNSELLYLHTAFYTPSLEGGLRFDDPQINIDWPLEVKDLSTRDQNHPFLKSDFQGINL